MRRLFAIIVAAIALAGCSMDNITVSYQTDHNDIYYASFEEFGDKTRTYVDEDVKLLWHEDDRISLFRTTLNEQFKFTGATGDNSGGFSAIPSDEWVTGNQVSTNYAVYPYDATTRLSNDEIIQLTMPAVQHYTENSFGRGANTMVAASENTSSKFLPFRNLGGYIIVKLYGEDTTIKSIEFKGNNEEVIAGAATAEAKYGYLPVVSMSESGTTTITLDCGEEGVTISSDSANPTSFWFVVPPITFEGGFTFTITDINGNTFTKSTTKSQTVVRNEVKSMSAFEPTFEGEVEDPEVAPKPANNEIWYTNGSATEATTPYKTDVFGANIVSNTYDADKECWVIKFDGDVTTIGDNTFYNCSSLTTITIPDSVTSIGSSTFSKCSGLTSITIPDSVTSIGRSAFSKCSGLTSITIPDSVTSIGAGAFNYCTGELIVNCNIPSASGYNYGAFYGSEFTSVTIGDSVTTIGGYAFYNCSSLTNITIGHGVTTIEWNAFRFCDSLTSVTIGDSVTSIGSYAFSMCTSLQEFKGNLASEDGRCLIIGGVLQAFAPAGITEYTIPDGVTAIGPTVFNPCPNLTSVTIPDSVTSIGDYAFGKKLTSVTIGNGVTSIGYSAFDSCSSLESVTIPDSVTTIGDSAFYGCAKLTSITIPDSVTTIGYSAFDSCSSLESVTIGNSVTTIGDSAFSDCTSLTSVYITDIAAWCNISFETSSSNPLDNGGNLYINNELVADLTIPDSVTEIGSYTFIGCSSLTSVTIPNGVTTIGSYALAYCDSLTSITIPDSVTTIESGAFRNCTSLTSVTIPNSVTTIGSYALAYCDSLTSITIPDSVTTIESGAFRNCTSLTSVTIPNSISIIGVYAFRNCTSLTSVTIPDSVTEIGDRAFCDCTSLTSVYCNPTTPPTGTPYMFQYNASDLKIYVPMESVGAYKGASGWSVYKSYIVGYNF